MLYPLGGGEYEYYQFAEAVNDAIRAYIVSVGNYGEDKGHYPEALLRTGSMDNLLYGARSMVPLAPDSVMWACTSASFMGGRAWAENQVRELEAFLKCPVSSTSLAFVQAVRAVGATRVGILASYPDEAADALKRFMEEHDIEVAALEILGADTGEDAFDFEVDWLVDKALAMNLEHCQALLVPDTAMPAFDLMNRLEPRLDIPVLGANQVTLWEGIRIAGRTVRVAGYGRLMAEPARMEAAGATG